MSDDMLTTSEAARTMGISVQRLRVLLSSGRVLGAQRFGPAWMIPRSALEAMPPRKNGRPRQSNREATHES